MDEIDSIASELEHRIFKRFCDAIIRTRPHSHSFYVDFKSDNATIDQDILHGYGFEMKEISRDGELLSILGIIIGDLSRPFRQFLHSYELKFTCRADWHAGENGTEQEISIHNLKDFNIEVLRDLSLDVIRVVKADVDAYLVEMAMFGEKESSSSMFDEMFEIK